MTWHSAATDWIIGVFVVAALYLAVKPGSPAVPALTAVFDVVAGLASAVVGPKEGT